jgi:WD40 repeat protein
MALSPDGKMVCSAASDETLRFWRVFDNRADEEEKITKRG